MSVVRPAHLIGVRKYALQRKLHYRVAFSRDGEEVYVQGLIRGANLQRSSNKMPAAVKEAIGQAIEAQGGLSAERDVHDMVKEVEECWS